MPRAKILIFGFLAALLLSASAQVPAAQDPAKLTEHFRKIYSGWRNAIIKRDGRAWQALTSDHRRISVRNRIYSERRRFPDAVFQLPAAPPSIQDLKILRARVKGRTAKITFFGKIDFNIGGKPTDNLLVVSYTREASGWKYDGMEFINLSALPDVRAALKKGDLTFVDTPDFLPTGKVERTPQALKNPVGLIAKTYVFAPGREVQLLVNKRSRHLIQNNKSSEIVIGGAYKGQNEIQYTIKDIPGGNPKDPITIRVYLMSQIQGTKPIKVFEYQVDDGAKPKASATDFFNVSDKMIRRIRGQAPPAGR